MVTVVWALTSCNGNPKAERFEDTDSTWWNPGDTIEITKDGWIKVKDNDTIKRFWIITPKEDSFLSKDNTISVQSEGGKVDIKIEGSPDFITHITQNRTFKQAVDLEIKNSTAASARSNLL